jgi:hypothetical protein
VLDCNTGSVPTLALISTPPIVQKCTQTNPGCTTSQKSEHYKLWADLTNNNKTVKLEIYIRLYARLHQLQRESQLDFTTGA